jgi:hypothetical protein
MHDNMLDKVQALRDDAWEVLRRSKPFHEFKTLEDAVAALGGVRKLGLPVQLVPAASGISVRSAGAVISVGPKRVSHGDVAQRVLFDAGTPLSIYKLMDESIRNGAVIHGEKPLNNFRSSLSRDDRFVSVMKDGNYFWWLTAQPLPKHWNEATEGKDPTAASLPFLHQEGGGSDATTNNMT